MATYRKPGTYARFVRTVSPVVNAGASRILGLVGTGVNYFTIQNEAVLKSSTKPYDELAHNNVFEILSVSSKPIYDGIITDDNIIYNVHTSTQRGYTINDNIISWDYLLDPSVSIDYSTCPKLYANDNITVAIDETAMYPVIDGNWVIEVSYINEEDDVNDPKLGCYRIINADTSEIIGEYVVSDYPVVNEDGTYPIPGVMLTVRNTYIKKDPFSSVPVVNVGDYVTVITVAAKTETEAKAYKQNVTIDGQYNLELNLNEQRRGDVLQVGQKCFNYFDFKWDDILGAANKYFLYAKTEAFDGYDESNPDKSIYTSNLAGVNRQEIQAQQKFTYNADLLKQIAGYNDAINKTFSVVIKDTTTTDAYLNKFNGEQPTQPLTISITINDYDKDNYKYYYKFVTQNGEEAPQELGDEVLLVKRTTTKIAVPDNTVSIRVGAYSYKGNYFYTNTIGNNDETVIGKDEHGIMEDDNTEVTTTGAIIPYDLYLGTDNNVIGYDIDRLTKKGTTKEELDNATTPSISAILTAAKQNLDVDTQNTWIGYSSTEQVIINDEETMFFNSSQYNVYTSYYFMLVAVDENDSPVDFDYESSSNITNTITATGATGGHDNTFGVVGATGDTFSITATGRSANSTEPSDTPGAITEGNLYNAITNIKVISNDTLYQHNAVYRLTLVQNIDGKAKFRITRYVNGELDVSWLDYAGIESLEYCKELAKESEYGDAHLKAFYKPDSDGNYDDFTFACEYRSEKGYDDENYGYWVTGSKYGEDGETEIHPQGVNSTYLADIDSELFDIIPGISFDFDIDSLPNLAYGSTILIVTTPKITSSDVPAEGDTYYVSYKYRKAEADYDPIFFTDYDDIVATYGNYDVSASSAVMNSLSLAAEIAFNNGVSQIVCCQAKNNSDYEMQSAIDRMRKEVAGASNVSTIIALTTSDAVGAYLQKHVDLMSSYEYGKERMGYVGARIGQKINKIATKADRSLGMTTVAEGYDDERIVYVVPGAIRRQIRDLRTGRYNTRTLPGVYAAVAVASVGLSQDPAEPLTNKNIAGFTEIVDLYSESEKNILAAAGCCVLEMRGQNIRIRHGITTNNNEVNSQEITLIQIKDYVIEGCRRVTADTYIGRKLTATLVADIKYTMESLLNGYVAEGVIISYSSLKVKRNADEPRQVDVSFEIEAVYPLNWISIEFGFSAVQ